MSVVTIVVLAPGGKGFTPFADQAGKDGGGHRERGEPCADFRNGAQQDGGDQADDERIGERNVSSAECGKGHDDAEEELNDGNDAGARSE